MEPTINYVNDWKYIHFDSIDSTNRYAKSIVGNTIIPNKLVIMADSQTNGYGRSQKNWESSSDKGLWMSAVIPVSVNIETLPQSTLVLAVAVQKAIHDVLGLNLKIKWPNDLLSQNGKKCAGLLVENVLLDNIDNPVCTLQSQYMLILGIGLNVTQDSGDFSIDIKNIATSLYLLSGVKTDKNQLIKNILINIEHFFSAWQHDGFANIRQQWLKHSFSIGQDIHFTINNQYREGQIVDLTESGALLVSLTDGSTITVDSGEIVFKS